MKIQEIMETTTSGAIATVSIPLGKVRKRMQSASVYEQDVANTYTYRSPTSAEDYKEKRNTLMDIINSGEEEAIKMAQDYLARLDNEAEKKGFK